MLGGMHASHAPPSAVAPLPGIEAALIGLAALAIVAIPFLWPLADQLDTMAHEGAHAAMASVMGFSVAGVLLHRSGSGATIAFGVNRGPRWTLVCFVGYLGPSAFGLWAAKLIETGRVVTVLWTAVILLVLLLFLIRKSFGIVSVPAAIVVLALVMRYSHAWLEEVVAYGMTWLLLLSGVRVARSHGARSGDAWNLSDATRVPRAIWALLWLAGTLLAVVIGGKWMILRS
jgi:hypothetical protein